MAGPSRTSKRQARLAFTPLSSSSPAAKSYNKQIQGRAAAVTLETSSSPVKRRKLDNIPQLDGANNDMPTPAASFQQNQGSVEGDSDSDPIRAIQRSVGTQLMRPSRKAKARQQQLDFSSARDVKSFSSPVKLTSSPRPQASTRPGIFSSTQRRRPTFEISSDESEEELPSPGKLVTKAKKKAAKKTIADVSNGRKTRNKQQPITVDSDSEEIVVRSKADHGSVEAQSEDDDDDMPTTTGKQRRRQGRRASRSSFISSSPPQVNSDDDVEIVEKPRNRRSKDGNSEDGSEDEPVTPRRQTLARSKRRQREQEEIEDDIEYLEPSSDVENSARRPRNTQTAEKSKRQSALEQLRRRRSGKPSESEPEDEEVLEDEEENDQDSSEPDEFHPKPISSAQVFRETEDDKDFIDEEEDKEQTLGAPDEAIPIGFTKFASMKPRELFKYAIEWMVQNKINPAFNRRDQLYDLTFRKLDDEVQALAGSKFESSVWRPDFSLALKARPDIAFEPIDRNSSEVFLVDKCQACGRTNHPATYQVQFQGKPYHPLTLEEVAGNDYDEGEHESSSDEEDNSDDVDDQPGYNDQGVQIPPANAVYYVGRFCQANAQTAHALRHWRYHLNEWVVNWLTPRYNTSAEIVRRDKWSTKKRRKHANKIVDIMEEEGVVKTLWHEFNSNIREARESKQGRYQSS